MGVQGLWELLAPVGRRVSVETLAGKKLAIDASIWMVQFMKAMRDEQGEMIRNAHLIGFFRRICKLLFLRTKPVFVFDGGTPALKRRTVIARRRQRENAQTKIRKTAEKLLLNHLKSMRLKELADNLEKQRKENEAKRKLPKGVVIENIETADRGNVASELVKDVEKNDLKGKSIMVDEEVEMYDGGLKSDENATRRFDQETLDAMLAASLAEEEDGIAAGYASTSVNDDIFSEEDDDEEEMMLPVIDGKVDPSILASLPPSMQLDLLVQMRERLMAENRQKYQKVKKAPAKFSELQIQSYLKTVAFRREINEVQKSAAGKDIGGVQTSRIASEANREFIFSSSFTGDKQILTSAGVGKNGERELQTTGKGPACSDSSKRVSSVTMLSSELLEAGPNRPTNDLNDVETYVDERGRIRVSRVRAMGIRMTRDLQRNLDLMKEIQQEKETPAEEREAIFNKIVLGDSETFSVNNHHMESSNQGNGIYSSFDDSEIQSEEPQILENRSAMNISFSEDDIVSKDAEDDDIFAQLVAGGSVAMSPHGNDASDCSWEEGIIDEKGVSSSDIADKEKLMSSDKVNIIDEDEMDWEDVVCNATEDGLTCPTVPVKTVSKGSLEEEANMAEAIRISLEDFTGEKSMLNSENKNFEVSNITFKVNTVRPDLMTKNDVINLLNLPVENATLPSQTSFEAVAGPEKLDHVINNSARQIDLSIELESRNDEKVIMLHKQCEENLVSGVAGSSEARGECGKELSFVGSKCSSMISSPVSAGMMSDTTGVCLSKANENDNIAKPTVHSGAVTETEKSLEELSSDSLSSSSDKKQNLATEKNLDVPEEEIKNTKDDSTIQGMEVPIDVSEASLDEEMQNLRQERIDLGDEQRKLERTAESVSSEMFAECQELLQMFGLPYIIAPMEAEAQCAYLELAKLVDGVVTDDSDVFLFGARNVYKNIFDDRKYVETYYMKDVESELGLSREQLIRMALLLGSDYTEGVSGIGIVNAIEVVNAFPEEDGLQKFREWLESPDPTILGKLDTQTGSTPRKRGSNGSNNDTESSKEMDAGTGGGENGSAGPDDKGSTEIVEETKRTFMNKHRNVSKNWHIPSSFPSEAVVSAYVSPQVDKSTESFSWGKPDLAVLRKLCWEKFGWNNQRSDDLLLPVLKEYNKHETQLRLEAFYTFNERFAKIRSQRIKKALKGITGKKSTELMGDLPDESSRRTMSSSEPDKFVDNSNVEEDMNAESKCGMRNKAAPKKRRKNIQNIPVSNESGEPSVNKEERHYTKKASSGNMRERGRGRGRGRQVGRGKRKVAPDYESPEAISNDRNDSDGELESQVEKTESLSEVRRSARPRKHVMYMENDSDLPGLTKPVDQGGVLNKHEVADRGQDCDGDICRDPANDPIDEDSERVLKGASDGDYLEMGGGFCFEEDKQEKVAVQLEPTRRRLFDCDESNQSLEDRYSGDYLAMGGGFCVDKGEPDNEQVPPVISPTRELDEDATRRSPSSSAGIRDAMGVLQEDKLPKADTLSTTGLTAIPFLRRKRRKT